MNVRDFDSGADGNGRWVFAYWDSARAVFVVSIENGFKGEPNAKLSADDVRELGLWCIDAYEAMGLEFPGLDRV